MDTIFSASFGHRLLDWRLNLLAWGAIFLQKHIPLDTVLPLCRARPQDADRLTALAHAAKAHWGYPEAWIEAWREALTLTAHFVETNPVYALESSNSKYEVEFLACYALASSPEGWHLAHVWVAPAHIGTGLGTKLVEHAMGTARDLGLDALLIDSDPNAVGFYERLGAQYLGEIPADVCGTARTLPRYSLALD